MLEFLLGQYCSSDDESVIEKGVQNVKHILADNFVRPDESQKILSQLRKIGSHTIIDMATVRPDMKKENVKAELKDGYLTISAVSAARNDEKNSDGLYIRRERYAGSGSRSFYAGEDVKQEDIKARFEDAL